MKPMLAALFLLVVTSLSAQKIEKYYDYTWKEVQDPTRARFYSLIEKKDSVWSRRDYYIHERTIQMQGYYKDRDCKTEHGEFTYYFNNGKLQMIGSYVNGNKSGSWITYHENGMMSDSVYYDEHGWIMGTSLGWHENGVMSDSTIIYPDGSGLSISWWDNGNPSAAGRYAPGKKLHAKWQYFYSNGKLSSEEVYDQGTLVNKQYYDEEGRKLSDTTTRDRTASFPGGLKEWQKYLERHIYFPPQYKFTNGDEAVVIVRFAVNEEGVVSEVTVTSSLHPDFDKIAVDVIKHSPKWDPALSHNRRIKEYRLQPVGFVQQ
ncbi:MAG: energy transducer TonB [Flavisolibacter sp.]